jgi:hypothetical protein
MKRKLLMILISAVLLLSLPLLPADAKFKDIKNEDVSLAAEVLQSFGITNGYEDGTFRPEEKLSRAQFCKFAVMAMGLGERIDSYSAKILFSDVRRGGGPQATSTLLIHRG